MFFAGAVVWKRAGTDLFDAFASVVRTMWEYGVENPEKREPINAGLNINQSCEILTVCFMEVRVYG